MLVPDGMGPLTYRHHLEETFTLLEGELEFTLRGETTTVSQRTTVNIPANAPHRFRNASGKTVHMLCRCTPAGQEGFFAQVGDWVASRISRPPKLNAEEQGERGKKAAELAPK